MSEWKEVSLGDCLEKIIGGGTPPKSKNEYWNGNIFWCSVKDMTLGKLKLFSTEDKITELGLKNSASNLIKKGTVITSTRMGLGRVFINEVDMAINQDLKALIPNNKINNNFLLQTILVKAEELDSLGTGSTVKGITLDILKSLKILLPPLPTQQRIASILSAYDDLIENNLQRIKLLEELAQRTYEEWFVKFNINGVQLKIGENGLPDGWERKKIGEVCNKITDGTHDSPKPMEDGFKLITGKHLINGNIDFESAYFISEIDHLKIQKRSGLERNDILFSNIGTLGNVSIVNYEKINFSCKNMIIFRPKKNMEYYLYSFLRNTKNKVNFLSQAFGSTQKFISLSYFRNFEETIPNFETIINFNESIKPNFETILNLQNQNRLLKESRDILLPRLMSGKVEV